MKLIESEPYCFKYIIATRSGEEKKFISDFQNDTFRFLKGEEKDTRVEILLKREGHISYLLCKSQGRGAKESSMRNDKERKLEKELSSLRDLIKAGKRKNPKDIDQMIGRKRERYSQVAKYYDIGFVPQHFDFVLPKEEVLPKRLTNSLTNLRKKVNSYEISYLKMKSCLAELERKYTNDFSNITTEIKEPDLSWNTIDELEAKARSLDGNYLLKTNRDDLSDDAIWNMYMMLTRVEDAFRKLKSDLGLRPNRHHKEKRADGHIHITILAYHLLHAIEFTLRRKAIHTTWPSIQRVLASHTYSTIILPTVDGPVINLRKAGIPESIHQQIYDKLEVDYSNLPVTKTVA